MVVSQAYVPDPTSVGQHVRDVAVAMATRGWRVVVFASNRGWENASDRYPRRELLDGVEVRRIGFSSFGKVGVPLRTVASTMFVLQATIRSLAVRNADCVLVSTCPPMAPLAGLALSALRRVPMVFWQMDVNPDQMISLGILRRDSLVARVFDRMNRAVLRRASAVVVLDRFMAARVNAKRDVRAKMTVLPPWPHEDALAPVAHDANPFRDAHRLTGKRVVMYSGNHTASNPVGTLVAAAQRLRDDPRLVFMFIGGGSGKREVEAAKSPNIVSLPYQPLEQLSFSLSAADVHVVIVGDAVVGIVHPCKAYGAMAVARPILLIGPDPCHVSDLLREQHCGWHIPHGDVERAVQVLRNIAECSAAELEEMGNRARAVVDSALSKAALCGSFCDIVEAAAAPGLVPSVRSGRSRAAARREPSATPLAPRA